MEKFTALNNAKDPKQWEPCYQWFEQNMDRLPASLKIKGMEIPDLPRTVRRLIEELRAALPKAPIYQGEFTILEKIKEEIQKSPEFQEDQ